MSYVGNTPTQQAFSPAVDYFSGNGSTVAFTLSRPVASVAQVQVTVNNVAQNPSTAFTVSSNTITFTGAPSSGTNNIYVQYTSPITQVIQPGQGTVGNTQIAAGAVSQTSLGTNVAGTGPAFSAYSNNTAQAVTSSTWTKVALNIEVFDTNSNFDPTTNYRFTPTVAGYYQINGSLYLNYTGAAGTRVGVSIYKNGSSYAENQLTNAAASLYGTMTVGALIYFNGTTDYVELYGWYNSATSQFYGVSIYTWLNGTLVRAA